MLVSYVACMVYACHVPKMHYEVQVTCIQTAAKYQIACWIAGRVCCKRFLDISVTLSHIYGTNTIIVGP